MLLGVIRSGLVSISHSVVRDGSLQRRSYDLLLLLLLLLVGEVVEGVEVGGESYAVDAVVGVVYMMPLVFERESDRGSCKSLQRLFSPI